MLDVILKNQQAIYEAERRDIENKRKAAQQDLIFKHAGEQLSILADHCLLNIMGGAFGAGETTGGVDGL